MDHHHQHHEHGQGEAQPKPQHHHNHHQMVADFKKRFFVSLVLTIPIVLLSPMIQHWFGLGEAIRFRFDAYILWALSSVLFFYGGWPFLAGLVSELKNKKPGMMTLVAVAISAAYLYSSAVTFGLSGEGFYWELATLIDIMLLGHWIEMKSVMGASKALEELVRLMPANAHLVTAGGVKDVPVSQLVLGDKILIKPGEKVPADSEVVEGHSSVNESMLTGESWPVEKQAGNMVIGGSVNGEGSLTAAVKKIGADSYLEQVIKLVRDAQKTKSRTQDLANRAAVWLTIIAIGGGALTALVWWLLNQDLDFILERAVTVMVIACPHALGLAVPLVVAVSTALAATRGLLIRDRAAFERARNIQAIVFDKTGTLTEGRFGVTDTISFAKELDESNILRLAAAVESHSEHPIAKGIVSAVKEIPQVTNFKAIPGKGAQGVVDGQEILVGRPSGQIPAQINEWGEQGKTVVFVYRQNQPIGAIALADIIRPESKAAIKQLKAIGVQCLMLTGDNERVAAWVAKEIGLDDYFAQVLPHEKVDKIKEVQARGLVVAMAGDGVNDAPALAQADIGIAVGAGTDVAIETADIILVKSNPLDAVNIVELSRATYKKMVQNLLWATGYNSFAMPLAAGVLYGFGIVLSPAMGAVLMSASTIIVAINARLLTIGVHGAKTENFLSP